VKILSVLTFPPGSFDDHPTSDDMEKMSAFAGRLIADGVLLHTGGRSPGMLELVVDRKSGASTVTDGPFTEAKELVGGYALLEVRDRAHAIEVTDRFLELIGKDASCHLHEIETNDG
jgi:hypothetical protein